MYPAIISETALKYYYIILELSKPISTKLLHTHKNRCYINNVIKIFSRRARETQSCLLIYTRVKGIQVYIINTSYHVILHEICL